MQIVNHDIQQFGKTTRDGSADKKIWFIKQGPCMDSYRTGQIVANPDLTGPSPWPQFVAE